MPSASSEASDTTGLVDASANPTPSMRRWVHAR
jgi:hypothetical protein